MYRTFKHRVQRVAAWSVVVTSTLAIAVVASAVGFSSSSTHSSTAPTVSVTTTSSPTGAGAQLSSSTSASRAAPIPGLVVAVSGTSLSVVKASGARVNYAMDSSTVVLRGRSITTVAALAVGEQVIVLASPRNATFAETIGILPSTGGDDASSTSHDS